MAVENYALIRDHTIVNVVVVDPEGPDFEDLMARWRTEYDEVVPAADLAHEDRIPGPGEVREGDGLPFALPSEPEAGE